jgi:hypothetical protein
MIGRLMLRPVMWAWRRIAAGCYGPPIRRGGKALWVPVAAVEAVEGVRFSAAALVAAGAHIPEIEEEAA